jgi:hypothetical protein
VNSETTSLNQDTNNLNPETTSLNQDINNLNPVWEKICQSMPNHLGNIRIGNNIYPSSMMELSNPTGKYVYRLFIHLINLYSRKGIIRIVGNNCAPGLSFPQLIQNKGISQFEGLALSCPIVAANIIGEHTFPDSVTIAAEPFMVLSTRANWNTFDDYVNALSSKYRVRVKKVYESSNSFTVEELNIKPGNEWIAPCAALLYDTLQDKTIAIGKNLPELLANYKFTLGNQYRVFGYFHQGNLMGFISCISNHDTLYAMQLGMNKSVSKESKLYQRMLLDVINLGIQSKVKYVNLGRTGTEIKSTLGAEPVSNSFVVFTRSKIALWAFKMYLKYFYRTPQFIIRKPFK